MRIQIVIMLFILTTSFSKIYSQCPFSIFVNSQEAVDKFLVDYPDCKKIDGDIRVFWSNTPAGETAIYSLRGFVNIEEVGGEIILAGNASSFGPSTLGGLNNLRKAGSIIFSNPPSIRNIDALENLQEVDTFQMSQLKNLTVVSEDVNFIVNHKLYVSTNTSMTSLGGIRCSADMEMVYFHGNNSLLSVPVLENLESVKTLLFRQNGNLTEIGDEFNIRVMDELTIYNNGELSNVQGINVNDKLSRLNLVSSYLDVNHFSNLTEVSDYCGINGVRMLDFLNNIETLGDTYITGLNFTFPDLEKLKTIGDLNLSRISDMPTLDFMDGVNFVGDVVSISRCDIPDLNSINLANASGPISVTLMDLPNLTDVNFLNGSPEVYILKLIELPVIDNFSGCQDLEKIHSVFELENLPNLNTLDDFNNLKSSGTLITINLPIANFQGLENLSLLTGAINYGKVTFKTAENQSLLNLNGLENLVYLQSDNPGAFTQIKINENPLLNSLDAIESIVVQNPIVEIRDNPELSYCSIDFVCSAISTNPTSNTFENNGPNCIDQETVVENCGFNYVKVFLDLDNNATKDVNEPYVSVGQLNLIDHYILYPDNGGVIPYFLGETHPDTVLYTVEDRWEITTNNNLIITSDPIIVPEIIEIGIFLKEEILEIETSLAYNTPICDQSYTITGTFKNTGTQIFDVETMLSAEGTFVSSIPDPEEINGNSLSYRFTNVLPGETRTIRTSFISPNIQQFPLGSDVNFSLNSTITGTNNEVITDSISRDEIFLCAYDPNDKQVYPIGVQDENYTLFETEKLEYLIRFQNTGNYPAQNVSITDTLSAHLDLKTFKFINSSHPITQIKRKGRVLEFIFKDIFLPDSIANEPLSHGFVNYKIEPFEDLPEFTRIENTAYIYFDNNPAIVTNTTFNTMVTEIPVNTSTSDENIEEQDLQIYPNPADNYIQLVKSNGDKIGRWELYDFTGQKINTGTGNPVDVSDLVNGAYFIKVNNLTKRIVVLH
ncbi:T9SS type A sorting domain-containing protein [Saprospiraceae bacterium]|nr:T9SS type A sorting domain-containing protein [Saprospiraceae bacterium]